MFAVFGFFDVMAAVLPSAFRFFSVLAIARSRWRLGMGAFVGVGLGWVGMGVWLLDGPVVGACTGSDGTRVAMGSWFSCATVNLAGGLNLSLI